MLSPEGVRLGSRSGYKTRRSTDNGNKYVKPEIHYIQLILNAKDTTSSETDPDEGGWFAGLQQFEEWTRIVWSDSGNPSLLDGQDILKALHPPPACLCFSSVRDPPCGPGEALSPDDAGLVTFVARTSKSLK